MSTAVLVTLIICGTILVIAILAAVVALKAISRWGEIGKGALDIAKGRSGKET